MRAHTWGSALFLIAAGAATSGRASAPGLLDPTFGAGGTARVAIADPASPPGPPYYFHGSDAFGLAVQPDGKILTVGAVSDSTLEETVVLIRQDASGVLDPTFGTAGLVLTGYPAADLTNFSEAIVVQPDGKIAITFPALLPPSELTIARFAADGTPDTSFGTGGIAQTSAGNLTATSMVRDADGSFLVAGYRSGDFMVARFDQNGTLDPGFGSGGFAITTFAPKTAKVFALAVQPDGRIVVAGRTEDVSPANNEFALARYDADGTLDATFGTGGVLTTDVGGNGSARAVLVQPDGSIVAGGGGSAGAVLARYDATGTLDASFGSGGVATAAPAYGAPPFAPVKVVTALALEPDGSIVSVGDVGVRVLLRWQPDGTLDPAFGDAGIVRTYGGAGNGVFGTAPGCGLARLAGGQLLVADREFSGPGYDTWTVARYLGGRCGNGIVEAGEDCDDGNLADGDGCPSSCCLADADGDGICDAVDPCTGGATPTRPSLTVRYGNVGGRNTLALKGKAILPAPLSPSDPSVDGIRLRISDALGGLVDVTLPPGLYGGSPAVGWKVRVGKWTYIDKRFARPFGIQRAVIQDASQVTPGLVKFSINSKSETYEEFHQNLPLTAQVIPNGVTAPSGQCIDVVFSGVPPCVYTPGIHGKVVCK